MTLSLRIPWCVFCILPGLFIPLSALVSLRLHKPSLGLCFASYRLPLPSLGDPSVSGPFFGDPGRLWNDICSAVFVGATLLATFPIASLWWGWRHRERDTLGWCFPFLETQCRSVGASVCLHKIFWANNNGWSSLDYFLFHPHCILWLVWQFCGFWYPSFPRWLCLRNFLWHHCQSELFPRPIH